MALISEAESRKDGKDIHLLIRCVSWDQFRPLLQSALTTQGDKTIVVVENNSKNLDRYPESITLIYYAGDLYEAAQLQRRLAGVISSKSFRLTIPMTNAWGIRYGELLAFADSLPDDRVSIVTIDDLQTHTPETVRANYAVAQAVLQRSRDRLKSMKDAFRDQRCFVLGNGRSLNDVDTSLLKREYTFGVNGVFHAQDRLGGMTTFYTVEDNLFIERSALLLRQLFARYCFFPLDYLPILGEREATVYLDWQPASLHTRLFSKDSSKRVYCGYSAVYINLQLAWYLGFNPVYIIGVDLDFNLDSEAATDVLVAKGGEGNHFHADYHQQGFEWYRPKVEEMYRSMQMAKDAFLADDRQIYKASPGGKLDLFEEVDFRQLF